MCEHACTNTNIFYVLAILVLNCLHPLLHQMLLTSETLYFSFTEEKMEFEIEYAGVADSNLDSELI